VCARGKVGRAQGDDGRYGLALRGLESKLDTRGRVVVERANRRPAQSFGAAVCPSDLAAARYREIVVDLESRDAGRRLLAGG